MSVVPLIPVTTGTKTASFLFLRTNTPCNSSLGSCPAGVLAGAGAGLPLLSYTAYFDYLQAVKLQKVSEESLQQATEHLKLSRSLFDVGSKPQLDRKSTRLNSS